MINYLREIDSGRTTESEWFFWAVSSFFSALGEGMERGTTQK